jgi:bifunctional DNase/RNase
MAPRLLVWLAPLVGLFYCLTGLAQASPANDLLEVHVKWVAIDPRGNTPMVILEESEGHRAFPIWIGLSEAQAITRALEGIPAPRPMTHDLMQNILAGLKATVTKIVVNDLRDSTFYATIYLARQGQEYRIDARPSDAIALALGVKAPIFTTKEVLGAVRTVTLPSPQATQQTATLFGMHLQGLDTALANAFDLPSTDGVLVAFVDAESQAERAGIQRGDVITRIDGKVVKSLQELQTIFREQPAGQEMVLHVRRERHAHTIRFAPLPPH